VSPSDRRAYGSALSTGGAGAPTSVGRRDDLRVVSRAWRGLRELPVAYTPQVVRASDVNSWRHLEGRGPHNLVIGTIVELGPIGLLLLALFLARSSPPRMGTRSGHDPGGARLAPDAGPLWPDILSKRKQVWLIGFAAGLAYLARQGGAPVDERPREAASAGATPRSAPAPAHPGGSARVVAPLQ